MDQMGELIIIPFIFVTQTIVSYSCALLVSKAFGFRKRPRNFVVAMGVFGNSNSLPISLVLSLAKTISGLHWDKIPGDNDDEVAARGILYLMIFQQLGQLMRWTWGFNVLLQPAHTYTEEEGGAPTPIEQFYHDDPERDMGNGLYFDFPPSSEVSSMADDAGDQSPTERNGHARGHSRRSSKHSHHYEPVVAPLPTTPILQPAKSFANGRHQVRPQRETNGRTLHRPRRPSLIKRTTVFSQQQAATLRSFGYRTLSPVFDSLHPALQSSLKVVWHHLARFFHGLWEFMNPPLWAILASLIVSSVPQLKSTFFTRGTFVNHTLTNAIIQSAGVAVPLIIVVLGANLARNTTYDDEDPHSHLERRLEKKLLIASIISRMLLPLLIMAPLLALTAKYVPVSILDDPIFIIVCFLLTGAPSALQLAQMCQLHNVYMGAVGKLLVQSYVVWLMPSTLVLVTCALKVVEWASD
jgi:predicted permease